MSVLLFAGQKGVTLILCRIIAHCAKQSKPPGLSPAETRGCRPFPKLITCSGKHRNFKSKRRLSRRKRAGYHNGMPKDIDPSYPVVL
jgi:hypothetical protein